MQQIILIGDAKQLCPVVESMASRRAGLSVSLFERLLRLWPQVNVQLNIQYRMREPLARYSSHLFYSGAIETDYTTSK